MYILHGNMKKIQTLECYPKSASSKAHRVKNRENEKRLYLYRGFYDS